MLVFISWSGQRSKVVAEALETWLAQVIQAVEPWISQDIDKGLRWGSEIASRLELSKVGIICLTNSNLNARWIHFEAGALSKTKDASVCTLLLDIKPSEVEQPLAQFQHTTTEKEDIFQLLSTINQAVQKSGEKALAEPVLREIFETYWPRLEKVFQESKTLQESVISPTRSENEMLQEVLEMLRNQERRQARLLEMDTMPKPRPIGYLRYFIEVSNGDEEKFNLLSRNLFQVDGFRGAIHRPNDYSMIDLIFSQPVSLDLLEGSAVEVDLNPTVVGASR